MVLERYVEEVTGWGGLSHYQVEDSGRHSAKRLRGFLWNQGCTDELSLLGAVQFGKAIGLSPSITRKQGG